MSIIITIFFSYSHITTSKLQTQKNSVTARRLEHTLYRYTISFTVCQFLPYPHTDPSNLFHDFNQFEKAMLRMTYQSHEHRHIINNTNEE